MRASKSTVEFERNLTGNMKEKRMLILDLRNTSKKP